MLDLKELQDAAYLVSVYNRAIHIPIHFKKSSYHLLNQHHWSQQSK